MRSAFRILLEAAKPALNSCPVCPTKGTCVFVTPGYEPGYCLHEYKRLHAFLASRLRVHPPAGAAGFSRVVDDLRGYAERLRSTRPYDPARPEADGIPRPFENRWAERAQTTLGRFDVPA